MGDTEADIVIIGGGFTGLSTALTLAEQFGAAPLVLKQTVQRGAVLAVTVGKVKMPQVVCTDPNGLKMGIRHRQTS